MKSSIKKHQPLVRRSQSKTVANLHWGIMLCMVVSTMFTACTKDEDTASVLIGEWTSVSTTGTIKLGSSQLDKDVEQTINNNIASYGLTDVVLFKFEKDGMNVYSRVLSFFGLYKYSFNNNALTFTASISTNDEFFDISFNGNNEFSIKSTGLYMSNVAILVASALCIEEIHKRGYESVEAAGIQLRSVNDLTITFKKLDE